MTSKSPDAPKEAGKSKQTEPAETMPRDVGEFVGTVAYEAQSIARLARGLCEADASQESAALIKRPSQPLDEGIHRASKSLIDQPLGEILDKKNVHVAEDEAVTSVSNLATVIASRLNILVEFAQAVQERSILGTPEGLQFLDKHRALHYPRIVPLVEPTAGLSQLAEENEQLKQENALIQKENDDLAHDLGQRDADAEFNASFSSGQSRRPPFERRRRALVERLLLVLAVLVAAGLGYWIAYLAHVDAAFAHGQAKAELELRHIAELNAETSARLAAESALLASEQEGLRVKAEAIADEKTRFVNSTKRVIRQFMDRGHDELIGVREQAIDEAPGEQFLTLRLAGELFRDSGIEDEELREHYDIIRADLIRQLTEFLYPNASVGDTLNSIALAAEGTDE